MVTKMLKINNGYSLPQIGFGTYPYKEPMVTCIPMAVEEYGVRLIDTSDNYQNEEYVGKGLSKLDLSKVTVISKFSRPFKTNELEKCFEESVNKLGVINIYLLHWPYPYLWKKQWRKMEELYLAGKCEAIGVCNFDIGYMKELLAFCKVKPAINQIERHPAYQQQKLVDFCHEQNIAVMAYSPVARMDKRLHETPVLKEIAKKYGKTTSQVILRWDIDTGCIPIPASSSVKHIAENYDIFDFILTSEEIDAINNLETGMRIRFNPRTRFSKKKKIEMLMYKFGVYNLICSGKRLIKK